MGVDGQSAYYSRKLSMGLCSVVNESLTPGKKHTVALKSLQKIKYEVLLHLVMLQVVESQYS